MATCAIPRSHGPSILIEQVKSCIDQCIQGPLSVRLRKVLNDAFGEEGRGATRLLAGQMEMYQQQHEELLRAWHITINQMLSEGLLTRTVLPDRWFALIEFLESDIYNEVNESGAADFILEELVLDEQDSDGESAGNSHTDQLLPVDEDDEQP
ncbi:uncharacterized protein PGTG_12254 [Puccinia graminis f. sp. tritici CRL 75-36-700-3]|uniref:Uncharacterized protein n=1 Tax=Puccinia graminis f. sp. tritici (strain CRL 75-36-700-3 / race SCCL) TaxID=418459 RepID=E3KPR3_PUCGT|nr:uncharacterized protein PGTG_12254 [Puccinia graminis f. sp. tritici CRL 75-36-700-3]EFP86298.1 hypothetical protein PGTG_12254 [Puccinia graminis f. sp. tritici CRL 75-36-700-3]